MILMKPILFLKIIRSALANCKQIDFAVEERIFDSIPSQYLFFLDFTLNVQMIIILLPTMLIVLLNCHSYTKVRFSYKIWQKLWITVGYHYPSNKQLMCHQRIFLNSNILQHERKPGNTPPPPQQPNSV